MSASPRGPSRSTGSASGAVAVVGAVLLGLTLIVGGAAAVRGLPLSAADLQRLQFAPPQQTDALDLGLVQEATDIVTQNYVDRSAIERRRQTYGAISGIVDSLGDVGHSRFLSPEELKQQQDALAGRLEGIGAELARRDGHLVIIAPIPGSPAQQAGLRTGDVVVRVDGQDVSELTVEQVVNKVRGPAGTQVTLDVIHPGDSSVTQVTVTRQRLTVPSVSWTIVPGTKSAHVLVSQFADHSSDELGAALGAARSSGAIGVVLDLRNNPGGLRDEAIASASQFIASGIVLVEQDAHGNRNMFAARPGGVATDMPLVVLVNEGSASSSEIVAGAIQDHGRGRFVGKKTFGTGTVLSTFPLSDGSALLLGTHEWLTPQGRIIWRQGITPDVTVDLPLNQFPTTPAEESAGVAQTLDAQLERALQELGGPPAQ